MISSLNKNLCLCVYIFVLLSLLFTPYANLMAEEDIDEFGSFYLQSRQIFYEAQEMTRDEKIKLLHEVESKSLDFVDSPYYTGAAVWIAQEYSVNELPNLAVKIFNNVLKKENISSNLRDVVRIELGIAYSRMGEDDKMRSVYEDIYEDANASNQIRAVAIDKVRVSYIKNDNWKKAGEIARQQLDLNYGELPLLYKTIARSYRVSEDYKNAQEYYQKILTECPDYKPLNKMIPIEKATLTCKHENNRYRIEYLDDMIEVIKRYEKSTLEEDIACKEVYLEYCDLAHSYSAANSAYESKNEKLPITYQQCLDRSLLYFQKGTEGIKAYLKADDNDIRLITTFYNSYLSMAQLLIETQRENEAIALLEDLLQDYSDKLSPDRVVYLQKMLSNAVLDRKNIPDASLFHPSNVLGDLDIEYDDVTESISSISLAEKKPIAEASENKNVLAYPEEPIANKPEKDKKRHLIYCWLGIPVVAIIGIMIYFRKLKRQNSK